MTEQAQKQLGATLWAIADEVRGSMNADDFRDCMLTFLFLRYLSDTYEATAREELGPDWPEAAPGRTPLQTWYEANPDDVPEFEKLLRRRLGLQSISWAPGCKDARKREQGDAPCGWASFRAISCKGLH